MKKVKPNYYKQILEVLIELKTAYPDYSLGQHISTIIDDYHDVWGITDKEFLFAVTKYRAQMELIEVPQETNEKELQRIYNEGMNLPSADELLGGY